MSQELAGGCLCGAVRFRAAGEGSDATVCHCRTCRRASGAPLVAWVTLPRAGFAFTQGDPVRYRSSPPVTRTFCGRCGTALTYAHDGRPETLDVTTISLDRADELPPRDHIWMSDSLRWIRDTESLPRFPRGRDMGE
jgi:hypothetical protein